MFDLPPILSALLTGLLSGSLLSIPVGPVNLTIFNEGARRGFIWGALIGFGASTMEVIYCAVAFTGFASFFNHGVIKTVMECASVIFLLVLGTKFLRAHAVAAHSRVADRFEEKLHPHSAFMTGFVRVMGNPGVLLSWIVLAASFTSREWVEPTHTSKFICCLGVALGTNLWFIGLSYAVSARKRKLREQTLVRMEQGSGIGLLALAAVQAISLVVQLIRHR